MKISIKRDKKGRFIKGISRPKEWSKILSEKTTGKKHFAWKGKKVGYRGLHYWLHRKLGKPTQCIKCKKISKKPRIIQWANIDGKYRRKLSDYIALCASCHKFQDLKLKSTADSPKSIRS